MAIVSTCSKVIKHCNLRIKAEQDAVQMDQCVLEPMQLCTMCALHSLSHAFVYQIQNLHPAQSGIVDNM